MSRLGRRRLRRLATQMSHSISASRTARTGEIAIGVAPPS